ncbi:MAG: hypothetical protein U0736_16455 [Gemmataceae bacterium]
MATVRPVDGRVSLGTLPVGFYRLCGGDGVDVSLAVLARLQAATPATSPVALDVAMAWFYPKERMPAVANLCTLAGVNWVRDRLAWPEMEPKPGRWAASTRYDHTARAQADAGLRVLQVHHASPAWANPDGKRFPLDLRHAYRFQREMARRWNGQVQAFEPWNEADIPMFGGHTGAEMASLQKAAWLGLKAGNPDAIGGLNVFADHKPAQLADLHANEAWPYFDTFNLHHYAPLDAFPRLYAAFRAVSAGRPLWVTECALPVRWTGDPKKQEPTEADQRLQAERVAQVFAASVHEGAVASFAFLLPHYVEGQIQFGLLRRDLTPRPAFAALAAVGRHLADARPLGRFDVNPKVRAFLFAARPDVTAREVLVAWTTDGTAWLPLPLPIRPVAVFDHLGRPRPVGDALALTTAPQFVILPAGTAGRLTLQPPPAAPSRLAGKPSPVVLQAIWPKERVALEQSAYRLVTPKGDEVPVFVYNFADTPVTGRREAPANDGWGVRLSRPAVTVEPMGRTEIRLILDAPSAAGAAPATVRVRGAFGPAGEPVLSLRVLPAATKK